MRFFALIIFCLNCSFSFGSEIEGQGGGQNLMFQNNQQLEPVELNRELLKKRKQQEEFNYFRKKAPDNWWDELKTWISKTWSNFWENLLGEPGRNGGFETLFKVLKYTIIAGVLVLIGYLFVRLNPGNTVLKEEGSGEVFLSEDEEIIKEKDIPDLIETALKENNYRLALRYSYLLVLKKLDERGCIDFEAQKTNNDYLTELQFPAIMPNFKHITRLYDFTWYGGFKVERERFENAQREVRKIESALKKEEHE